MQENFKHPIITILFAIFVFLCTNGQEVKVKHSREILDFLFKDDKASWDMDGVRSEGYRMVGMRTKDFKKEKIVVPDSILEELFSIKRSNKNWSQKLAEMAEIKPFDLIVGWKSGEQILIGNVINKFGEPEEEWEGNIYSFPPGHSEGAWYSFGSIRLGVPEGEEYILSVWVDGPKWQKEMSAMKIK